MGEGIPDGLQDAINRHDKKHVRNAASKGGHHAQLRRKDAIQKMVSEDMQSSDPLNVTNDEGDVIPEQGLSDEEREAYIHGRAQAMFRVGRRKGILPNMNESMSSQHAVERDTEDKVSKEELSPEEVQQRIDDIRKRLAEEGAKDDVPNYDDPPKQQ